MKNKAGKKQGNMAKTCKKIGDIILFLLRSFFNVSWTLNEWEYSIKIGEKRKKFKKFHSLSIFCSIYDAVKQ